MKEKNIDLLSKKEELFDDVEVINEDNNVINKEPTEEEIKEQKISAIKSMHLRYKTKKNFGVSFRKERKRKMKQAKKSRKINRKK